MTKNIKRFLPPFHDRLHRTSLLPSLPIVVDVGKMILVFVDVDGSRYQPSYFFEGLCYSYFVGCCYDDVQSSDRGGIGEGVLTFEPFDGVVWFYCCLK